MRRSILGLSVPAQAIDVRQMPERIKSTMVLTTTIFYNGEQQMLVRDLTVGMVVFGAWTSAAFSQDIAAGEASFKKCQVCHDVGEAVRVKLGPPLTGSTGARSARASSTTAMGSRAPVSRGAKAASASTSKTRAPSLPIPE